jgi:hypothetical protein
MTGMQISMFIRFTPFAIAGVGWLEHAATRGSALGRAGRAALAQGAEPLQTSPVI